MVRLIYFILLYRILQTLGEKENMSSLNESIERVVSEMSQEDRELVEAEARSQNLSVPEWIKQALRNYIARFNAEKK